MDFRLLNKFANNKCYPNEVDEVFSWIQQSDVRSGELLFKQYWDKIKSDQSFDSNLAQQRLDRIHHRININQSEKPVLGKIRTSPRGKTYLLALLSKVAVILLIPVVTLLIYTHFAQSSFVASNEIISPPGSRTFLELSDGTKVWLNHGSKMIYPQKFTGKTRTVLLIGEGYFDVAHDTSNPFVVESEGMLVKAVGTTFNVKAYSDGSYFETTLESGKVLVQKKSSGKESIVCAMTPGQHFALDLNTNKYSLKSENLFKYVAWKDGKLVFDGDRLEKVAERLSQWYNVEIILKDPQLNDLTYNATFIDESLSQIIDMMQIVMPITCVEVKRGKTNDGAYMKKEILIYLKNN